MRVVVHQADITVRGKEGRRSEWWEREFFYHTNFFVSFPSCKIEDGGIGVDMYWWFSTMAVFLLGLHDIHSPD
jgi:hypothetical protein